MKLPSLNTSEGIVVLAVAGFVAYVIYKSYQTANGIAGAVKTGIDPTNPDNIINSGVTAIGGAVTGDKDWTLGGQIYDWTHSSPTVTAPTVVNDNESAAESARLNRQNASPSDIFDLPPSVGIGDVLVGMGTDTHTANENQDYSPSAIGFA